MSVLNSVTYDPAAAVSKLTTALQAMTAMDTTNLRLAFTVPTSGRVLVHLRGTIHGGTALGAIHVGVMEGATIKGRVTPRIVAGGTAAATTFYDFEAAFVVSGLTGGAALTWDAAWGVETAATTAGTAIKYGGPNDATANNAFGALQFEIWEA